MALQKPVDPSSFKLIFKRSFKDFWKDLAVAYCWLFFFLFGIYFGFQIPSLFVDKHTWITASADFVSSLSGLAALYGIKTTRPSWMFPLLVVTATNTGFFVEGTRKSVVAAIENIIFRADENYRFYNNGYRSGLLRNCLCLFAWCLYLFTFCRAFKTVRAEKKASESLPFHQAPLHRSFPDDSDKKPILQDV